MRLKSRDEYDENKPPCSLSVHGVEFRIRKVIEPHHTFQTDIE